MGERYFDKKHGNQIGVENFEFYPAQLAWVSLRQKMRTTFVDVINDLQFQEAVSRSALR